jgi:serine/threonine protein kinase
MCVNQLCFQFKNFEYYILLGNYSQKVDVWAAGVLLHVLLMGTLPFQGKSVEAIFDVIKTAELDFHSSQWASVSLLVHDLIGRMLNREVSSRPDAEDVLPKFKHPCNFCFIYLYYSISPYCRRPHPCTGSASQCPSARAPRSFFPGVRWIRRESPTNHGSTSLVHASVGPQITHPSWQRQTDKI